MAPIAKALHAFGDCELRIVKQTDGFFLPGRTKARGGLLESVFVLARNVPLVLKLILTLFVYGVPAYGYDNWFVQSDYQLVAVVPEKIRLSEYISPRKYPDARGREYPTGSFALTIEGRPTEWLKLYSESIFDVDGTALNTEGGVYNYRDVFQHKLYGVKFEQAYAHFDLGRAILKVGLQKFAWGKLDVLSPNDLLNPVETYNVFLSGLSGIRENEVGIPCTEAGYYLTNDDRGFRPTEMSIEAVWEPFYVPPRFDNIGERWFPPTLSAQQHLNVGGTPVTVNLGLDSAPPPGRLNRPTIALRFANSWPRLDFDLYYYYGYQTSFFARAGVREQLRVSPPPLFNATVDVAALPLFRRLQSIGAGFATGFGPFEIRADIAEQKSVLFAHDLNEVLNAPSTLQQLRIVLNSLTGKTTPIALPALAEAADVLRSGVSIDYSIQGYLLLFQMNQSDRMRNVRHAIIPAHETQLIALVRKSYMDGRIQLSAAGLYDVQAGYSLFAPTFLYRFTDRVEATIGYLKISGPERSLLGQFHGNNEVFLTWHYWM